MGWNQPSASGGGIGGTPVDPASAEGSLIDLASEVAGLLPAGAIGAHGGAHVRGGADEMDGDTLDIDFSPANYTPDISPSEVSSTEHLTAHLKGVDKKLTSLAEKAGKVLLVTFTGNPKTAAVAFASSFADADYSTQLTCEASGGSQFSPCAESITASGFTINMGANNISGLVSMRWTATKHGET